MEYRKPDSIGFGVSDEMLTAIGTVAMSWAQAEHQVNFLICSLIPITDLKGQNAFCGTIDMRYKIELAKYFARLRISDDTKFELVKTFLTRLADYSSERNRVVHDSWTGDTRFQIRPNLIKPQAGMATSLTTFSEVQMSALEVMDIAKAIVSVSQGLMLMTFFYLRDQKDGPTPWPDISESLPPKAKHPRVDS